MHNSSCRYCAGYKALYNAAMNSTDTTEGGYYNSAMKKSNLATAISTINSAFRSISVMVHRNLFVNAVVIGGHQMGLGMI